GGSGTGKTTFVNQSVILSHLLAGEKVFWYNAEFKNDIGLKNFLQCVTKRQDDIEMIEKGRFKGKMRYEFAMKEESFERLKKCLGDNLCIYRDSVLNDPETVFVEIEKHARLTGIKTIVIDNLMCLKNRDIEDDNRAVTVLMMKLKELANELGLAIFIVAHTKKGQKGMESQESIAGSSNVGNLADNVLILTKELKDEEKINYYIANNATNIPPSKDGNIVNDRKIIIDKNRNDGDLENVCLIFDKKLRRFDTGSGSVLSVDYEAELLKVLGKQREQAKQSIEIPEDVF
ncbi:MAG: AAA family ATPase, partial [Sarcina sp.]